MTIVLICIVVAVGLALVGGFLLLSGQREERGEAMAAAPAQYRPPGPVPPRVRVRGRDEAHPTAQPTQAHAAPKSDEPPLPAPATPAATAAPAPDVPAPPAPVASRPTDGAVRAAGHARLEAALARARARLDDAPDPAER